MATPGELIKMVAAATGTPAPTVTQHDRNLFLAGLRTKGGRGRSAATVTARDAAHLLTAVLGSGQVKDSAETALRYRDTVEYHNRFFKKPPKNPQKHVATYAQIKLSALDALSGEHSFIDALETLITLATDETFDHEIGTDPYNCIIHVEWPRTVGRISIHLVLRGATKRGHAIAVYQRYDGDAYGRLAKPPQERSGPIEREARIYSTPLRYIGALLGDRLHKLPPLKARRQSRSHAE
jgi:hypothetical protein